MATVERGFLLLADLTGYTAYLARGELAHAPVIAGDLLETVVGRLEPPFRLAKLEGDAAFLFAEDGRAEPALLLDAIVASYLAFRRRLRSIEAASACECKACALAPRLDLKAFVHYGDYLRSTIAGRDELSGADVIVAHRLLKGAGAASAAGHGFVLFTAPAADALGLDAHSGALVAGIESIEHLGDVATLTLDLEERWAVDATARRVDDSVGTPLFAIAVDLEARPADAWAHLTSPALRPAWDGPLEITETLVDGMRGVGGTARCVTGRLATIEEIVDWVPYEHVGRRVAVPGIGSVDTSHDLEPVDGGTRLEVRWRSAAQPVDAAAVEQARLDTEAALGRLRKVVGRGMAVLQGAEVTR
jgi:Protein of unknown function (DUF2652)/Polyketide cyclase / dehydrase and lipid transport